MNRRAFLSNAGTLAVAGCAINFSSGVLAQDLRPVITPPQLTVARGADSPVVVQAVRIEAELSGSRALTTVEMTFFNPNARVLEGELQFPLLDGQQVTGIALDIDGKLREAVPVEKAKGQQVFEDVIRQRIDPALLQTTIGNNYKLRVYPLPANGTRRVLLRFAETLPATGNGLRRYRLPLEYARDLAGFSLRVTVRAPEIAPSLSVKPDGLEFKVRGVDYEAEITRKDYAARGMLQIDLPVSTRAEVRTQVFGERTYFVAEVPAPSGNGRNRNVPDIAGIVWDASGSGAARDHKREIALLDAYFKHMRNGEARLARVRNDQEPVERFRIVNGDWEPLRRALETTPYDGATRLGAFTPENDVREYLLFSDGLDNFGEQPFARLNVPLYTINTATRADHVRLRQLAEASGGRYADLTAISAADAARRLLTSEPRILDLHGDGVTAMVASSRYAENGRWLIAGQLQAESGSVSVTYANPASRAGSLEIRIPVRAGANADTLAAAAWAQMRVAELDGEYRLNRAEIRRLGIAFSMPTRETSLIVLDRVEDYVRHEIAPPAELRAQYDRQRQSLHLRAGQERTQQLDRVVRMFNEKIAWWEKEFPKGERERKNIKPEARAGGGGPGDDSRFLGRAQSESRRDAPAEALQDRARMSPPRPVAAPAPARMAEMAAGALTQSADSVAASSSISIQLKRATPDAPYFKRFRDARNDELYRIYLDERPAYLNSTAFFLDVADVFFDKGLAALGVRILTNLAEMDLENRHILRILGYRLLQAGQPKLAIPVLARVLELAPNEPQSYRDLGLALAADKQWQKAVDNLNEVVIRPWHGRFPEIELIALAEMNAIIATATADASRVDPRLKRNLPLDLRVVMTWDADNTDIDLWVTDPNGEKAYYGNRISYQGGRMSQDFTGGYGPEEFSLKKAKTGKYKVEANFYGHNQQVVAGATTLQMKLATHFGTREVKEQSVTLRLKGRSEVVFVGEFEVK